MILLDSLVPGFGVVAGMSAALSLTGSALYDIRLLRDQRQRRLHPYAKQYRRRPVVSVIVTTQDNESGIAACLHSLLASRYRKLDIIIADNASSDGTKSIVRQYIAQNPEKRLKLYAKRRAATRRQLLQGALVKAHGDLVLVLEGSHTVDKACLSRAVDHINSRPDTNLLLINNKFRPSYKAAGLFQEFRLLLRSRNKKAASAYQVLPFADNETYMGSKSAWKSLLKQSKKHGRASLKIGYLSNAVTLGQPLPVLSLVKDSYGSQIQRTRAWFKSLSLISSRPLSSYLIGLLFLTLSGLAAIMLPILLTYFIYLAFGLHEPDFLVISWVTLSLFLLLAIWEDDQLSLTAKLKYFLLSPFTYVWFYLLGAVSYLALPATLKPGAGKRPDIA